MDLCLASLHLGLLLGESLGPSTLPLLKTPAGVVQRGAGVCRNYTWGPAREQCPCHSCSVTFAPLEVSVQTEAALICTLECWVIECITSQLHKKFVLAECRKSIIVMRWCFSALRISTRNMSTQVIKNVGIPELQKVGKQSRGDCIRKYTTTLFSPLNVKRYVGGVILNCLCSHPYLVMLIWRKNNILAVWWLSSSVLLW